MEIKKYTVLLLVTDKYGVLTRIAGLFSRRAYNIDSLSVGRTNTSGVSRITIVVECGDETIEQIVEQVRKLIDVIAVELADGKPTVARELMLVKIRSSGASSGLTDAINVFRGKIIDLTPDSVVVEITGEEDKLEAFLQYAATFGILEVSRTGVTALKRGGDCLWK